MEKKILYIDMDNVIVNFPSGIDSLDESVKKEFEGRYDEVPSIFSKMQPISKAIESVQILTKYYSVYILSTAPWNNPSAWSDKIEWIQKYFWKDQHSVLYKRLILSHHKNLNKWDYLIDDRMANGAWEFSGELIQFGSEKFPSWNEVVDYLLRKYNSEIINIVK